MQTSSEPQPSDAPTQPSKQGHSAQEHALEALHVLLLNTPPADATRGIFTACRAWRDSVLMTSPRARLVLDSTDSQAPYLRLRQLRATGQALQKRGKLPTAVAIHTREQDSGSEAACALILSTLRDLLSCHSTPCLPTPFSHTMARYPRPARPTCPPASPDHSLVQIVLAQSSHPHPRS